MPLTVKPDYTGKQDLTQTLKADGIITLTEKSHTLWVEEENLSRGSPFKNGNDEENFEPNIIPKSSPIKVTV